MSVATCSSRQRTGVAQRLDAPGNGYRARSGREPRAAGREHESAGREQLVKVGLARLRKVGARTTVGKVNGLETKVPEPPQRGRSRELQKPIPEEVGLYRWLRLARSLDLELCQLSSRWFPARGEEAVIVGSFCDLRATDIAAPHYRDPFVVYLMRGAELWRLVAQVLGKPDGYNKGRSVPFTGPFQLNIVPWVAGDLGTSISVATGAALALNVKANNDVVVCTFGDGVANRGDVHESLNLAALWRLPIVFVCQNNGWAISQPVSSYLSAPVAARAAGYGIPGVQVDGQDVEEVRGVVARAVIRARNREGPTLIEALTVRGAGHWAGDTEDYRDRTGERAIRDPLDLYRSRLLNQGLASLDVLREVDNDIDQSVLQAVSTAFAARDVSEGDIAIGEVFV